MNETALETTGLGMRYSRTWALRGVTLTLEKGKIAALVGPNGAGKTTLIHLAAGLLIPAEGKVRVFGCSPTSEAEKVLPLIGYIGQDRPVYRNYSVQDMLRFGKALNPRWDGDLANRRLKQLAIPFDRPLGKLSGGQQAQVSLVVALAKRPELLLLDEPVAALDPLARRAFFQTLVDAVVENGTTTLFSSHQVADLDRVCDSLILLADSRLQLNGNIESLLMEHAWVSCPVEDQAEASQLGQVLQSSVTSRSVKLLIQAAVFSPRPGWDIQPVSFEDLILAYLALTDDPQAQPVGTQADMEVKL